MDNGLAMVDHHMGKFLSELAIKHHLVTPLWPQANGEVEHYNRTLLKRLCIVHAFREDWREALEIFLFYYQTTPHSVTRVEPPELRFGYPV
jgi:hypothetical protein